MMRTAARFGSSSSLVSGWSTLENVATAETARVSSRAYGAAAWARCCALMIRDAAMSSMARVIFFIDSVDLIRARYSRSDTAMLDYSFSASAALLLDDLLLLELVVLHGLFLDLVADVDRAALRGLELLDEGVVGLAQLRRGLVGELLRVADLAEELGVRAAQVVEQLALEARD